MTVIVDPPNAPGHGRLWSHVASDTSFEELHAFAQALGIPARGFDRDHYDIPAEYYDRALEAGAQPVSSRELITRLVAAGLRRPKNQTLGPRRPGRLLLRPPRLRDGDVVAVVSPAGPVSPERLGAGVEVLRSWGLVVRSPGGLSHDRLSWLAGSDEERATQFTEAWLDPDVRAVWMARGGYGTQRMLDLLDWSALADAAPTILIGFSDLTVLHQAVASRLGAMTVHAAGVGGLGDGDAVSVEATKDLLFGGGPAQLTGVATDGGGVAEGVLLGGNVTVLASTSGTPLVQPATGGIALLEDVGEAPYRLDRSLTQLIRTGWFDGVRGIALGAFTDCGDPAAVEALLDDRLTPLGVPILRGLSVGHLATNLPVPLGVRARLDAGAGTLDIARCLH